MLYCNETATLVRHITGKTEDRYECVAMVGVSWFGKRGAASASGGDRTDGSAPKNEYAVRIPEAVVPEPLPKAGDILIRGILAEYTGRKCLEGREAFCISYVGDNRRGRYLRHVVVKNT